MSTSIDAKPAKKATKPRTRKPAASKKATTPSTEEIARLAEQYWAERGRPHGSPEHDWIRAEQALMSSAS